MRARRRLRGARRRDALPLRPLHLAVGRGRQRRPRRLDDARRARGADDDASPRDARLAGDLPPAGPARERGRDRRPHLRRPHRARARRRLDGARAPRLRLPVPRDGDAARAFAEQLEIVHRLWSDDRVDFRGRHYTLEDAPAQPKPVQQPHPPLIVGGSGTRGTAEPAARFADEYNTPFASPEDFARIRANVERACERRPGRTLRFSTMTGCLIGETRDDALERARQLYGRVPRDADFDAWLAAYAQRALIGSRRRDRRAAPRLRARRLRARHAPAPPAHRPRAGAADRPARAAARLGRPRATDARRVQMRRCLGTSRRSASSSATRRSHATKNVAHGGRPSSSKRNA